MAGKSLGTLTLDLLVKTGSFITGFSKAERESKKFSDNVSKNLRNTATAFTGLVAGATAATTALVKNSINIAAGFDDISQSSGIAVESISALSYAAELEGVSVESLGSSLNKFSKTIATARDESSAAAVTFQSLGIAIKNADGSLRDSDELLLEVADRFSRIEDGAAKAAAAQQLFGKSGADLIPFLNNGRDAIIQLTDEAERLGLVISATTAKQADEFNQNLLTLGKIVEGTGLQISAKLLPQLVEFSELVKDPATQEAIARLVTGIADVAIAAVDAGVKLVGFVTDVSEAIASFTTGTAVDDVERLTEELVDLDAKLANIKSPDFDYSGSFGPLDDYIAGLEARRNEIQTLLDFNEPAATPPTPPVPELPPLPEINLVDPETIKAAGDLQKLFDDRLASYKEETALVGEVTELQKLRYEIENGALQGISEQNAAILEGYAQQLDRNEQLKKVAEERLEVQKEQDKQNAEFNQTVEGLQREIELYGEVTRAEALRYDLASGNLQNLTAAQGEYLLSLNEQLDALDAAAEADEERQKALEKQAERLQEYWNQAARSVQSAFADALTGVESNFGDTINRIAAEWASSEILKQIGSGLSGSSNGFLASIGQLFAGGFATGGMIPAGQFGVVGEMGPEIVTGPANVVGTRQTESIMNNNRNVTINMSLPGITNANEASRAQSQLYRDLRQAVDSAMRYG